MTGAYLRVQRNGKWENVEVEYLTDDEREQALADDPRLIHWLHLVCKTLAKCENPLLTLVDGEVKPKI